MYAMENPQAVLESRSPVQRICNNLCRFVSRNHGPDGFFWEDLWCFLFRWKSIYAEIYEEIWMQGFRERISEGTCSDEFDEIRILQPLFI